MAPQAASPRGARPRRCLPPSEAVSDYYGNETLESWVAHELFCRNEVAPEVIAFFEKWREEIELEVRTWLASDAGDGNHYSWRAWGCGLASIPEKDMAEFDAALLAAAQLVNVATPTS